MKDLEEGSPCNAATGLIVHQQGRGLKDMLGLQKQLSRRSVERRFRGYDLKETVDITSAHSCMMHRNSTRVFISRPCVSCKKDGSMQCRYFQVSSQISKVNQQKTLRETRLKRNITYDRSKLNTRADDET